MKALLLTSTLIVFLLAACETTHPPPSPAALGSDKAPVIDPREDRARMQHLPRETRESLLRQMAMAPRPIYRPPLPDPQPKLSEWGITGDVVPRVVFALKLDERGHVTDVRIVENDFEAYDHEAFLDEVIAIVRTWRYGRPKNMTEAAFAQWHHQPVHFRPRE